VMKIVVKTIAKGGATWFLPFGGRHHLKMALLVGFDKYSSKNIDMAVDRKRILCEIQIIVSVVRVVVPKTAATDKLAVLCLRIWRKYCRSPCPRVF
jgi:hypothetical protein